MERKHIAWLIIAAVIVIGIWVAAPFVISNHYPSRTDRGTFGDLYGSINALFSGLALLGVVAAIMLQQKELSLSTKELRNSARALQKQVELSADAARIQVLPGLIQAQKVRIETMSAGDYEGLSNQDYSEQLVRDRIQTIRDDFPKMALYIETLNSKVKTAPEASHAPRGVQSKQAILYEISQAEGRQKREHLILPEFEMLIRYMTDMVHLYQKISDTKIDFDASLETKSS